MRSVQKNKEYYFCGLLLTLGLVLYSLLYLTNVYPFTEGWGIYYAELLDRGCLPYRDFYYYLPPLGLLIDWLFWKLSFGYLLLFRLWYVLQRIVMTWLLYALLSKWIAPRFSWIASLTAIILRTSVVWDLGGDYNQTQTLLALLLIHVVGRFLENEEQGISKGIGRYCYIFLAGTIIAVTVLLKQSAGLAALLVCFLFLIFYCVCFKDNRFIQYCIATALGAVVPLGIFLIYLLATDSLGPFVEQFFGAAASKGGIMTILFAGWEVLISNVKYLILLFVLLLVIWSAVKGSKHEISTNIVLGQIVLLILTARVYFSEFVVGLEAALQTSTLLLGIVIFVFILTIWLINRTRQICPEKENGYVCTYYFSCLFLFSLAITSLNPLSLNSLLYKQTTLFPGVPDIINHLSILGAVWCLIAGFYYKLNKDQMIFPRAVFFLLAGGIADAYANLMNSSTDVYPICGFISAALMISGLMALNLRKWNSAKNIVICLFCAIVCGTAMVQKAAAAYSWWGSEVTYSLEERAESVELKAMSGLKLAYQRKLEFEEVTKLIEENDEEDSTVWGYPHIKIFNILTDHFNVDDPVPVLFYDVCSDSAALEEVTWLRENHPDFVVWCDMPWCIEVHEQIFRNGEPLGQREIISWFTEVKDTDYEKIGQVGNLFVYKLKNGSPVNYTYFQNPDLLNGTSGEY